jgi:hypothetical protein
MVAYVLFPWMAASALADCGFDHDSHHHHRSYNKVLEGFPGAQ